MGLSKIGQLGVAAAALVASGCDVQEKIVKATDGIGAPECLDNTMLAGNQSVSDLHFETSNELSGPTVDGGQLIAHLVPKTGGGGDVSPDRIQRMANNLIKLIAFDGASPEDALLGCFDGGRGGDSCGVWTPDSYMDGNHLVVSTPAGEAGSVTCFVAAEGFPPKPLGGRDTCQRIYSIDGYGEVCYSTITLPDGTLGAQVF
ncbi:hypothetical protein HOD30_01000 [Candidatus Peregrinibacteria bacterium]|nr:hypothetical protein [Candidatus Peregrinibacteria bacterium]MBT4631881.1 hypothetical protein [Candidatus Peregrinibacteria bacterium]MBT5516663.1 hypothetical protein [Candidatus Peregrinibacteria bacterium]MBT5824198.1 hypothetical protein [Candidatus Peregrinibacteria bacterium]